MDNFENLLKSAKNYLNSGKFSKAIGLYEKALKEAKPEGKAKIKKELAYCLLRSGDLDSALKEAKEAEESFARLGEEIELARARLLVANVMLEMGESEGARNLSVEVYESFKGTGRNEIVGLAQRMLGRAFAQLGDYEQAKDFFQDSLSTFRRADDEGEMLIAYNCIANVNFATSDYKQALLDLEKGLGIAQKKGSQWNEALFLSNIGTLYRKTGKWIKAEDYINRSLEIKMKMGDPIPLAHGYISLGRLKALRRDLNRSEELLNKALTLAQEHGYEREEAMALESLGDLAQERGDRALARDYYQRTLDIGRRLTQKDLINQVQRRRAELFLMERQNLEASECFKEALKVSQSLGDRLEEGCCFRVQALIFEAQGNLEGVRENFEKAIRILESIEEKFELGRTLLAEGRFTISVLKDNYEGLEQLQRGGNLFGQIEGADYYQGLVGLELTSAELAADNLKAASAHLRKSEDIFQVKGEKEELKRVEALKGELNSRLTQPTAQKYKVLKGLGSSELGEIFEWVIREVKADRGFVAYRTKGSKEEMIIEKRHNLTKAQTKELLSLLASGDGFESGNPSILYDTGLDDRFSSLGAGSVMITPFASKTKGRIDALLYVDRQKKEEPFLDREFDLFYSLSERVGKAIYQRRQQELEEELRELKKNLKGSGILTRNPQMLNLLKVIELARDRDTPILLSGETGTGKDFLARSIHEESIRKDKDFVEIPCGAIPRDLVETELFGHEKGAFTGATCRKLGRIELAGGGTLFLNEVGELSKSTQVKLLRFLDRNEFERVGGNKTIRVDTRVIAATNKDLKAEMEKGSFRKDLYYRLNVLCVDLPPLRERKEDIPLLANHFMKIYAEKYEKRVQGMVPGVLEAMMDYEWPGNIRELENVIETMVILAKEGKEISAELLPKQVMVTIPKKGSIRTSFRVKETLKEMEKRVIQETLRRTKGSKYEASKLLGVGKSTLYRKIKEYRLK